MTGRVLSRRSALAGLTAGAAAVAGGIRAEDLLGGSGPRPVAAMLDDLVGSYDFNQGWLFGGPYVKGAESPGHDDSGYARVTLPHTVTDLSWAGWDYRTWERTWIYRKHFDSAFVAGSRVLVTFNGVMTNATVVLNGRVVATHAGGYLPWTAELTGHLRPRGNVLAVIVDGRWLDVPPDALPGGPPTMDFLQPAGIYRDVRLEVVPDIYLEDVFVLPRNVLAAGRTVLVTATVQAGTVPRDGAAAVTAALLDGDRTLATARTTLRIGRPGTHAVALTIGGTGPVSYWSPEQPRLYTVRTTLTYAAGSGVRARPGGTHTTGTRTGFRAAVFRQDGFYLNGSRYKIFGLNRHQLFPYLGMAAPARLQRRDAEILKNELNVNMVRCSHYPQSPHFLDACDELGIMVWEEPPGWGFVGDAAFQRQVLANVRDMVVRDRNRPSVVVWGTRLDETKNYPALYARAREIAYALDGSRQASGAMTTQSTAGWAEDVFGYDDYHVVAGEPSLAAPVAGVPYLVSEAVGTILPTFRWFDPPAVLAGQAYAHALVHDQAGSDPAVRGADRLVRLRLLLGAAVGQRRLGTDQELARDEDAGCCRRVPGAEARRRRLPGPGRPGGQAGDRPRVLLGRPDAAGCRGHVRHQLRPPGDLPGRRAPRDRHAAGGDVRQPRSPARVRRPHGRRGRPARLASRRVHRGRRAAGRHAADDGRHEPRPAGAHR